MKYFVEWAGKTHVVEIDADDSGTRVLVDGIPHPVDVAPVDEGGLLNLIVDGASVTYGAYFENGAAVLSFHDREVRVTIEDERSRLARLATGGKRGGARGGDIKSVMPGVVKEIRVQAGDRVESGDTLLILEAMKMENEIRAPTGGEVAKVHVAAGTAVEKGAPLIDLRG
jgi:pyruvate carboxylase subunit B